jgi:hypothetical protein
MIHKMSHKNRQIMCEPPEAHACHYTALSILLLYTELVENSVHYLMTLLVTKIIVLVIGKWILSTVGMIKTREN